MYKHAHKSFQQHQVKYMYIAKPYVAFEFKS